MTHHQIRMGSHLAGFLRLVFLSTCASLLLLNVAAISGWAQNSATLQIEAIVKTGQSDVEGAPAEQMYLQAQLTGDNGRGIGGKWVYFYLLPDFFVDEPVYLGKGFTDYSKGIASFPYTPKLDTPQRYRAVVEDKTLGTVQTEEFITAKVAVPSYEPPAAKLIELRRIASWGSGIVTLVVWGVILGVLLRVLVTLPSKTTETSS